MKISSIAIRLFVASLATAPVALTQTVATAERFADLALSPDGRQLAWAGPAQKGRTGPPREVVIATKNGTWSPLVVALPGAASSSAREVTWSANGKQLAVLASNDHGAPSLYVVSNDGKNARLLLTIAGEAHDLRWSPDGSRIALLYSAPDEQANGPVAATPRDTGVMDTHIDRQHLAIVDLAAAKLKLLSPRDLYIYEFDWAPNGRQLVVSQASGSGNNNWWVARLSTIDASSGAMHDIAEPKTQLAEPRWSPDGSQIAYIGGLMSDQGATGGDLFIVPAAGGTPRNLTPHITSSFASFDWSSPAALLTTAYAQGETQLASVDARTGAVTPVWTSEDNLSTGRGVASVSAAGSITANGGTIATVRESFARPPEIWAGAPAELTQVTHVNDGVRAAFGKGVSVKWKSESFDVQGFLLYPANFDASRKYPMIVQVHGGPSSAVRPAFYAPDSYEAAESDAGYFVFMPNPRGSYGEGEAFTKANVKDFGHGDLKDIMSGVDEVLRRYPVDSARMGIRGWSYGGFMTMWAVTQTHRFKAAVTGAGISNWLSYTGENGISAWMVPFFGATAYEDKAVYDKSSPINFMSNAKTPTLIVVGERDAECPAPQSFEFWRALQHEGVTTQLVVYPDEGHHFANPQHARDVIQRTVRWMDAYLKGPKT
jgi:dipeptidyl aminopeptidase/acylaminoacyl peptidase